jgi:CRISPR-associated protein Csc1
LNLIKGNLKIFRVDITLHDYLFYASREMGYLWETAPLIHNYSLTYALNFCQSSYHFSNPQIPKYAEHLQTVNAAEIYVTPAKLNLVESGSQTSDTQFWKLEFNGEKYHKRTASRDNTKTNIPLIGRNKLIHPEVCFTAYLLLKNLPNLPKWIRLGKWDSKAEVIYTELNYTQEKGNFKTQIYLNPLDINPKTNIKSFDVFNMPPSSLIQNLHAEGEYFELENGIQLPAKLSYRIIEK